MRGCVEPPQNAGEVCCAGHWRSRSGLERPQSDQVAATLPSIRMHRCHKSERARGILKPLRIAFHIQVPPAMMRQGVRVALCFLLVACLWNLAESGARAGAGTLSSAHGLIHRPSAHRARPAGMVSHAHSSNWFMRCIALQEETTMHAQHLPEGQGPLVCHPARIDCCIALGSSVPSCQASHACNCSQWGLGPATCRRMLRHAVQIALRCAPRSPIQKPHVQGA